MAVVEAVENTSYREDGGSAYLTTRVKTLEPLKGEFGDVLHVTQGVKNGGTPGRYATEDPDRYAVLEPGRQYVIAVQSGSTAGTAGTAGTEGTAAWAWYAEPARRGVAGEREHWQEALTKSAPSGRGQQLRGRAGGLMSGGRDGPEGDPGGSTGSLRSPF
ncbi:hypothetical protein ACFWWM_22265 [Streptomyces sp. NPDC058682]|uniref:hypothetical protein n=1 Tax=Streptomyces sp. NPDC058682 TaxID=3346596 RepID=UPI003654F6AE